MEELKHRFENIINCNIVDYFKIKSKYYNENIEFGVVRSNCHRRQIAGRSSRNNRSSAAGQHQDMGAHW